MLGPTFENQNTFDKILAEQGQIEIIDQFLYKLLHSLRKYNT